jgi:very-short-patch-repair endonuclease
MDLVREILRGAAKEGRHAETWQRLQKDASDRPESTLVETPSGGVWMSPIESKFYEAMTAEGLSPVPQYCVEGYFVDFAFPDIRLAVEADGAAFHGGEARQRDHKRDWILGNAGWTVKRFHGSTIYARASNCAFVVKREVETARSIRREMAEAAEAARKRRNAALMAPLRKLLALLRRKPPAEGPPPQVPVPP